MLSALSTSLWGAVPQPVNAVSANPAAVCIGSTCTITFPYTGDYYSWIAPVSGSYTFEVWGSQGGNAGYNGSLLSAGGLGGYAKGNINLTSSETVLVYVGGQGAGLSGTPISSATAGGWNGGGAGYVGSSSSDSRGAGGGGGTDIRVGGSALSNRVIVAGGGAGGAIYIGYGTNIPGVGGGTVGGDGATANYNSSQPYNGKGGTQSAGGTKGTNCNAGSTNGALGQGGQGEAIGMGSAGGGGGYWGGGGSGCGMGGGGGSGYVGGVSNTTLTSGNASMPNPSGGTMTGRTGNGVARISYTNAPVTVSLSTAGNSRVASKGQTLTLTATSDSIGRVTFFADGKRIPGCISLSIPVGTRSCTWKAAAQKISKLSAMVVPTGGGATGYSSELTVSVARRTGTR